MFLHIIPRIGKTQVRTRLKIKIMESLSDNNKMSDFFNYILTKFLLSIGYISSKLSIKSRMRFGNILGDAMRFFGTSRRKITKDNIRNSFPELSLIAKENILRNLIEIWQLLSLKCLR